MKISQVAGVFVTLLVIGAGVLYWQNLTSDSLALPSELAQTINQCDLIAGKAASGLPEALPFQRLEKMARQSRVLDRCMQDRGYQQNPKWVGWANKHARKIARAQDISQDEAYETIRRQAMLKDGGDGPEYWRKQQ